MMLCMHSALSCNSTAHARLNRDVVQIKQMPREVTDVLQLLSTSGVIATLTDDAAHQYLQQAPNTSAIAGLQSRY